MVNREENYWRNTGNVADEDQITRQFCLYTFMDFNETSYYPCKL